MTILTKTRFVLAVPDAGISVAYYRDILGMAIEFEVPGWTFLARDSFVLMLGECPDALPPNELGDHSWFAYVTVDLVDELYQELCGRGVQLVKPLADEPWGMREFGVRTIDGHRIMFGQELN